MVREAGHLYHSYEFSPQLPALLAVQEARHLPGDRAMVRRRRPRRPAGTRRSRSINEDVRWHPAWGRSRIEAMVSLRARLVHQPPASLGRADPGPGLRACGTQLLTAETAPPTSATYSGPGRGRRLVLEAGRGDPSPRARPARSAAGPLSARKATSSTSGSSRAPATGRSSRSRATGPRFPGLSLYLEGSDQHRGWFQSSILTAVATTRPGPVRGRADSRLHRRRARQEDGQVGRQRRLGREGDRAIWRPMSLRLYVASLDYADDVRMSDRGIKETSEGLPEDPQHLPLPLGQP